MKTSLALTALFFTLAPARAEPVVLQSEETRTPLLELFTSEGCSSCPPADQWVSQLKQRPDLWRRFVPIVFHVDYWDGLGWPDRFATKAYMDRQRRYAAAWQSNSVYTPSLVWNGREWDDWFSHQTFPKLPSLRPGRLAVTVRASSQVEVVFDRLDSTLQPRQIEVALLSGGLSSDVQRGENRGRVLQHDFIVLGLVNSPLQAKGERFSATISLPEKTVAVPAALAAWVTTGDAQPPLQAVGGWLQNP